MKRISFVVSDAKEDFGIKQAEKLCHKGFNVIVEEADEEAYG